MATRTELYIDTLGGLDLDGSTDKNLQYFVVENLATLPDSSRTSSTMSASQECGVSNHLRYDTIRDAILTCAQKLIYYVSLIRRTETNN